MVSVSFRESQQCVKFDPQDQRYLDAAEGWLGLGCCLEAMESWVVGNDSDMVQQSSGARACSFCLVFSVVLCAVGCILHADTFYVTSAFGVLRFNGDGAGSLFASGGLNNPAGMVLDRQGNLYVANYLSNTIDKITPTGFRSEFANTGASGPVGLAIDNSGNIYAALMFGYTIMKYTPEGVGSVFANSLLAEPYALTFDRAGNLYVANDGYYAGGLSGTVTRFTPDGIGSVYATGFKDPQGLAFDAAGDLFVANSCAHTIEKITPSGVVSTFASGLNAPIGLGFDSSDNLYAVINYDNAVLKFAPDGTASLFVAVLNPNLILIEVPEPSGPMILGLGALSLLSATRRVSGPTGWLRFAEPSG